MTGRLGPRSAAAHRVRARPRTAAALTAALAIGLATGLAVAGAHPDASGTVTRERAAAGVEERVWSTQREVVPRARLEELARLAVPCSFWNDRSSWFRLEHDYWVRGVPARDQVRVIEAVRDRWLAGRYRLRLSRNDAAGRLAEVVVTDRSGFGLSMWRNPDGDLVLRGASPCLRAPDLGPTPP